MEKNKIRLHFPLCPGDTLVGTTAIECLHNQHPGKFLTDVSGTAVDAIFENNPHITKLDNAEKITMNYPLINQCNQRNIHFVEAYVHYLADKLNVKIECTYNKPFLYLSDKEKKWINQVEEIANYKGKFWLICSGNKNDYTVKSWGHHNYQSVVDALYGEIQFVQIGESGHNHKPLNNAINLLGKTSQRQLIRLSWHAQGGLGAVSYLHHIFSAFQKPFVCIASGMEPTTWEKYNTEIYLTRQGCLPCCKTGGCWKARTTKLGDDDKKDANICLLPVIGPETIPKCMVMIHPEEVVKAVRSYYLGGLLSH